MGAVFPHLILLYLAPAIANERQTQIFVENLLPNQADFASLHCNLQIVSARGHYLNQSDVAVLSARKMSMKSGFPTE
jgi:hypothetical protein